MKFRALVFTTKIINDFTKNVGQHIFKKRDNRKEEVQKKIRY